MEGGKRDVREASRAVAGDKSLTILIPLRHK